MVLKEYKNEKKSTSWSAHGPATMKISGINPIKKKNPKAVGPSGSGGSGRKLCQKKQKKNVIYTTSFAKLVTVVR